MRRIVAFLTTMIVAVVACYMQAPATITPEPSPTPKPATITPDALVDTFTVTASALNVRDQNHDVITGDYFTRGARIQCRLQPSGWCILADATIDSGSSGIRQVWAGCLAPNPQNRGCEEK